MSKQTYDRRKYDTDWENRIRETWFHEHAARFSSATELGTLATKGQRTVHLMTWRRPDSTNYLVRYVIDGGILAVWGDTGDAIYGWSEQLTWEFLAGLDLHYFHGKCCASEQGRSYNDWDHRVAALRLDEYIVDAPTELRVRDRGGFESLYRRDEWHHWLASNGHDCFGEGISEVSDLGSVIAWRCRAHLIGLKMAVAQKAAKVSG